MLEDSLKASIKEIDGVFTYVVATENELGMAKDTMAAKPMVLFDSDDVLALASEEVAIRAIVPHEIDTSDPYDEEVRVWQRCRDRPLPSRSACPMRWACTPGRLAAARGKPSSTSNLHARTTVFVSTPSARSV